MLQEITIRTMLITDAEMVNALTKQLGYNISAAQTKNNIEAILNNKYCEEFVAIFNNKVAGWITVMSVVTLESHPFCEVRGLVVDEALRNRRIGKMLIEKVMQWSREKNAERLVVKCNAIRKEAHAFYRYLGFNEKKEQKVFEIYVQ